MKKRYLYLFLSLVLGTLTLSGCEDVAQVQTPIDYAQLRVANFNNTCDDQIAQVYDVYIYPVGQPEGLPIVRGGLSYGVVSPWIDNLPTNRDAGMTYKVQVRPAGDVEKRNIVDKEITLKPGDKYTLWIFKQQDIATPRSEFIADKPGFEVAATKAYFRFINTEEGTTLSLKVGDPLGGNPINGQPNIDFMKYTGYEGFNSTTLDTTLTFFVVDGNANVVGRIAGVALESGTYKTITWGGNCPTRYAPQEDGAVARPDSHHVRILDDAGDGTDETKIVPQTLRYFFVNALIPPTYDNIANLVDYDQLGVVVNNDNRYNFAPLAPYSVGPTPNVVGGVINVVPTATLLTDAVNVKGYVYNASSPNTRGPLLFDYRAGPRASMVTDQLVAFVLSDTVRKHTIGTKHPIDSAKGQVVVQIPDQPRANEATFVVLNMLAPPAKPPATTNKAEFFVNDVEIDRGPGNWSPKTYELAYAPGDADVKISARVNAADAETYSTTFRADKGGIYLIVLVGRRLSPTPQDDPHFMIIRTNPQ